MMGSLNRRALFGVPATVATMAAPANAAPAHPDARLLELGREYDVVWTAYWKARTSAQAAESAFEAVRTPTGRELDPRYAARRAAQDRAHEIEAEAYEVAWRLQARIIDEPCRTLEGLRIKALVAHHNREPGDLDFSEKASLSVVDFILKMGAH